MEKETRIYEITGTQEQLDILERIFGRIEALGDMGSSRTISVFVDGDGSARLKIRKNGEKLQHEDVVYGDAKFVTDSNGNVKSDLG